METTYNPTPSDLLHMFLDGELEPAQESSLFNALADNSELRTEMRELLAIRSAVSGDQEAFTPPVATTKALFSTLGFTAPGAAPELPVPAAEPVSTTVGTKIAALMSKVWIPVMSAALGTVAAGLIVSNIYENKLHSQADMFAAKINSQAQKISENETKLAELQMQYSMDRSAHPGEVAIKPLPVFEPSFIRNGGGGARVRTMGTTLASAESSRSGLALQKLREPDFPAAQPVAPVTQATEEAPESKANIIFADPTESSTEFAMTEVSPLPSVESDVKIPNVMELSAQLRSMAGYSFPNIPDVGAGNSILNNLALRIATSFNRQISLGVEFGQETFGQEFMMKENGRNYTVQQSPSLLWAGASVQYTTGEIMSDTRIFTRGILGATYIGPLGKVLTGIEYEPIPSVNMMLGAEGSWLNYDYQGLSYNTYKLGFTYGISVRF